MYGPDFPMEDYGLVRFEGGTTSGYKPHKVEIDDPSGGRDNLPEEELRGHFAEFIMPNLTPLSYPPC